MSNSDFRAGTRVGEYVLDSYIGGGSFGAVWRGHSEADDQPVAIKLLTGALATGDTSPMRADVELLAAAAASRSEHVVKVLGGGVEPVPYVVMELIEGSDLQALLQAQGTLGAQKTVEVGLALTDALRALSQVGIIHRDIKPANVMIDSAGVIKLADFGIAKIVGYSGMTMTGQTAMTMAYAAPEVWDEGSAFGRPSHRTDLYAMGVVLYQCLVGMPPFVGNYGALYKAHTESAPDLKALPADTPPALRILIRRCLEKRQDERPRDAAECLALLMRAQVELTEASGTPTKEPRRLGPWLRETPHPSVPWTWRCRNERTGEVATVELHFADSVEYGTGLSRALDANSALTPLGAERVIDSNRQLLYPGESWQAAPAAEFLFWVAREDRDVSAARSINEATLRNAVPAIARLVEAGAAQGMALDFGHDNLTVEEAGSVYLRRPGIATPTVGSEASAMSALATLPLDERAKRLVDMANSFRDLVSMLSPLADNATTVIASAASATDATHIVQRPRPEEATRVVEPAAVVAPPVVVQTPPPPPVQPLTAASSGGNRSGPRIPLIAGGLAAVAAIAVAAVVLASSSGGKSNDNKQANGGQNQPPAAGYTSAPAVVATTAPAVTSTSAPAALPTRPPAATATVPPVAPTAVPAPALPSQAVIEAAVDNSNKVYIAAYRNGDINALSSVFTGDALAYYKADMQKMLNANQRQDNGLLSSSTTDFQAVDATHANIRTRERWSYKVVGSSAAPLLTTYDEYYELVKVNGVWLVSVNTFNKVS